HAEPNVFSQPQNDSNTYTTCGSVKEAQGTKLYSTYESIRKQHRKEQQSSRRVYFNRIKKDFRKQQALVDIEQQLGSPKLDYDDYGCVSGEAYSVD
ncbi:hypothetical protein LTR22_028327, partial [Elasticomyces elasticus]